MAEMTVIEAVRSALREEMERDERVFVMGEDVGQRGGVFLATQGFIEDFGPQRVLDTPLAEASIMGIALGAAFRGMRPVPEVQFSDFVWPSVNQLIGEAARVYYGTNGALKVPMTVRIPYGGGIRGGLYHSQNVEALFFHTPGLLVVTPSTPYEAKGLLKSAIRDDNPVIFLEHKKTYRLVRGEVPDGDYTIPIGPADVKRVGSDVTVVSYGLAMHYCLAAAEAVAADGISAEVVDLRTLKPLDTETILDSVRKTGKLLVVHEDNISGEELIVAEFIELPHVGESVVEGTIGKWLKQPGDRIERYDPLVEVVTDKVTMEVPSPVAGQLLRIIAAEGETVPMGAPIAEVETDGRGTPAAQPANDATTAPAPAASVPVGAPPTTPAATPASPTPTAYLITDARPVGPTGGSAVEALDKEAAATVSDAARPGPLSTAIAPPQAQVPQPVIVAPQTDVDVERAANLLSPAVRRLASEHSIDVSRIAGTGLGGRITRNDVLRFLESAAAADDAPRTEYAAQTMVADGDEERIATTPVRRMIAEAMVRSVSQIPHAWSMVEVDITDLVALRNRERDGFRQREGINLTYLPFALKAVAAR
ncbi:2-oxoisovalerate dehydrogenase subunit beta [Geodia barretti]|uniref:Dihydrolipoamide acetyltransferase component of pyruvate dehydrogenase complex n=1 Tax=Geodia barretti TaxID=519541 RepID=A0AA35R173_GEOBA|nr:2-oxoisovalerate dehydrogenase subunit beta [Geodia barretti]